MSKAKKVGEGKEEGKEGQLELRKHNVWAPHPAGRRLNAVSPNRDSEDWLLIRKDGKRATEEHVPLFLVCI